MKPSFGTRFFLFNALAVPCVLAGVQEIWWNITYVENASPDGLFERRVIGVNNTWPYVFTIHFFRADKLIKVYFRPPPVDVQTTDSLVVHVLNSLDKPTTLHHHGMFFNSTSWMDGAQGVSEWLVHAAVRSLLC